MNNSQKFVIVGCLLVACGMLMVPPWKGLGYEPIFSVVGSPIVDYGRIAIQFGILASIGIGLFLGLSSPKEGDPKNIQKSGLVIFVFSLIALIIFVGLWAISSINERKLLEQQIAKERILQKERLAAIEQAGNELAKAERIKTQRLEAEEEEATALRLKRLAEQKQWNDQTDVVPGVTASLYTYWQDGRILFRLDLKGSVEDLEFARANNHSYVLDLFEAHREAIVHQRFYADDFVKRRNSKGAISSLSIPWQPEPMSSETYESGQRWKLNLER